MSNFENRKYPESDYYLHYFELVNYIIETDDSKEEIKKVTENTKQRINISKNSKGSTTVSWC